MIKVQRDNIGLFRWDGRSSFRNAAPCNQPGNRHLWPDDGNCRIDGNVGRLVHREILRHLCAIGRYAPYGRESVVPIRGGIDVIWRAFPNAVPNFRVKVIELMPAEGNTVVIQAEMSGPIPAEVPGIAKKGQDVHIPHCYILRFDADGKITRLDAYWDNTVLNSIQASAV